MTGHSLDRWLVGIGIAIVCAGGVVILLGLVARTGALGWLGRLPGDFSWKGEHYLVFFPLASMLLISLLLTLGLYLLRRFL